MTAEQQDDLWAWMQPPAAEARRLRDERANDAVNAVHGHWRVAAEECIRRLAASGEEFTAETVTARIGSPPGHANAVGGLFIGASKRGLIRPVGYRQAQRTEAHARVLRVWKGTGRVLEPPTPKPSAVRTTDTRAAPASTVGTWTTADTTAPCRPRRSHLTSLPPKCGKP